MAPVAVLATKPVTPLARRLGIITPLTPTASAVRKIEPKLRGSFKLSKIKKTALVD